MLGVAARLMKTCSVSTIAKCAVIVGTIMVGTVVVSLRAQARVSADCHYTKAQTFNGALRYLRVDRGFAVTEKDPEAAYLMFDYPLPGQRDRTSSGSIEVVETKQGVKIYVAIPRMPEYHEQVLKDELLRKLADEYGKPVTPRKKPKPKPAPDAGAG